MPRLKAHLVWLALLLAGALPCAAASASNGASPEPWRDWQTSLQVDHALAGRIWSTGRKAFVAPAELAAALAGADFVLIGETHDNADHHRLQAWLIAALAKRRKPAVVMEMIGLEQADALGRYLAQDGADASGLGAAVAWSKRGWPPWAMYQPIAEAARRKRLLLDRPLGTALDAALLKELAASHCGLLPERVLPAMSKVQRLRDAVLADSLIDAGRPDGAVLIAGNGHVRTDRAVPWYVARRLPKARILSVMLIELDAETKRPEDGLITDPDGKAAADFVWYTPRRDREDPCESLRKHLAK